MSTGPAWAQVAPAPTPATPTTSTFSQVEASVQQQLAESTAELVKLREEIMQEKVPLGPTLDNAHKIEATRESILAHIQKGGPVMIPILILAAAAMSVALFKWLMLARIRNPSDSRILALLHAVAKHDEDAARAQAVGGPTGEMLMIGVEHIHEPAELIEEMMYEKVLTTRLQVQRFLPFISISAASAPLLGLLGTVTGIISTFKLLTVFGAGDVKSLSGGISEALITTEFGLIVAIPSLLLHAFLSRKARGVIDNDALFVRVDTDREEVKNLFREHNVATMPVLDQDNRLVGRITRNGE